MSANNGTGIIVGASNGVVSGALVSGNIAAGNSGAGISVSGDSTVVEMLFMIITKCRLLNI